MGKYETIDLPHYPISIMILEDHKVIVDGLERIFGSVDDITVCAKSYGIEAGRELLKEAQPDVLLLDISLPDGDGLALCSELTKLYPKLKILMLTTYCEYSVIMRALENGAHGYVVKNALPDELIEAVRTVAEGEQFICEEARRVMRAHRNTEVVKLTRQEQEILRLIVRGCQNEEIADTMNLGYETIKSYRKNLIRKLDVHNTAGLVKKAIEEKWV